jgi:D-alanyl-D-alanine carboxypeptidase
MRHRQFKGKIILLSILFFAISTGDSYGQSRKLKKIQKIIDEATARHLVGVAVYIKTSEGNEWIGVSGFQHKESGKLMETGSIFATGSIGKMYNAVAALKLIEQGRLQLNANIS